jgi:hypothetical protein
VFLIVCDLEASTVRKPRAGFGCYATEKKKQVWKLQILYAFKCNIEFNTIIVHVYKEFYCHSLITFVIMIIQ